LKRRTSDAGRKRRKTVCVERKRRSAGRKKRRLSRRKGKKSALNEKRSARRKEKSVKRNAKPNSSANERNAGRDGSEKRSGISRRATIAKSEPKNATDQGRGDGRETTLENDRDDIAQIAEERKTMCHSLKSRSRKLLYRNYWQKDTNWPSLPPNHQLEPGVLV
jgi:hypothetical protein